MNKMLFNILHRVKAADQSFRAMQLQQDIAHKHGIKTTMLVSYGALNVPEIVEYLKDQSASYGDEIGISFGDYLNDEIKEEFQTKEFAVYLLSFEKRKAIITRHVEKFNKVFGFYPVSGGSYLIDAATLQWIKSSYPSMQISVINCFEEGVHMFLGNQCQWYLFSDGGPWGAYYPSKANSLCPAKHKDDDAGIIGVPHLNRDMLLSLTSRDDYFSSHPANVIRGRANDGDEAPYLYRFTDQWIKQIDYNGFTYYNIYVSPGWLLPNRNFEESSEDVKKLYDDCLKYLNDKVSEDKAVCMTMGEFAIWYRENVPVGRPEINYWKDILCGSKREIFWYVDPFFRITIDPNCGGSITDLRPYAGQVEKNLGPDTRHLANGNYPFIVNAEHRGGFYDGSIHCCKVSWKNETISLVKRRTKIKKVERVSDKKTVVTLEPVHVKFSDLTASIVSVFIFAGEGRVAIERKVIQLSHPDARVTVTEYHRGCWGTNIYPEDMRDIELMTADKNGNVKDCIRYSYDCRTARIDNPGYVSAVIPQASCRVSLSPVDTADYADYEEGYLFRPFYTLTMNKKIGKGEVLKTWLMIEAK